MAIVYEAEDSIVYALHDGKKIGQISVPHIDFHWGEGVYVPLAGIGGVGTEEAFRGKGIASGMMAEAKKLALEQGYCCSGVSTNLGNVAQRLYAKSGYTTLFRPGRFEKNLEEREFPEVEGVEIRPCREGDEKVLMELFEDLYAPFFGWRKKTSARWEALRKEVREKDPGFIFIAEDEEGIQGWSGTFQQWVGLVTELYVRPSEKRTAIARRLLFLMENHLLSQGIKEAHCWLSPEDAFSAHFLTVNGYRFTEQRVFMLSILDLPKLLEALVPLFERRLKGSACWKGAMRIKTPLQEGLLRTEDEAVRAEEKGKPDVEVLMSQEILAKVLSGVLGFWEAYLEGFLSVRPRMTPEMKFLLETLFPKAPWTHPADDLW